MKRTKLNGMACLCGNRLNNNARTFINKSSCHIMQSLGNLNRFYIVCKTFHIKYEILIIDTEK